MCVFDWGVTAAWVSAIAVIAGVVLGLVQLNGLRESDAVKNTLSFVRQFNSDVIQVDNMTFTVAKALTKMDDISFKNELIKRQLALASNTTPTNDVEEFFQAGVVVFNYFDEAADLYARNLIDRELFMSRFSLILTTGLEAGRDIINNVQKLAPSNMDAFNGFRKSALKYRLAKGYNEPTLLALALPGPDSWPPNEPRTRFKMGRLEIRW